MDLPIIHMHPRRSIRRFGLGWEVLVLDSRGLGWAGHAPTRRSAERLADRLEEDLKR